MFFEKCVDSEKHGAVDRGWKALQSSAGGPDAPMSPVRSWCISPRSHPCSQSVLPRAPWVLPGPSRKGQLGSMCPVLSIISLFFLLL